MNKCEYVEMPLHAALQLFPEAFETFPVYRLLRDPDRCIVRVDVHKRIIEIGPPPSGEWVIH